MSNNWQLDLIAGLDGTQSRNQLNSDIKGISRHLDKLKLYTEIDKNQVKQLQHQLKNLQVQLNNVTVSDAVINGLVTKINAGLQNVNIGNINVRNINEIDNQAQNISNSFTKSKNAIDSFKKSLSNAGKGSKEIDSIIRKIQNLNVNIDALSFSESTKGMMNVDVSGLDEFGNKVKITRSLIKDLKDESQWNVSNTTTSVISTKELENINNAFVDYTAKIAQFKSTNTNILSGLTEPLNDFESKLNGLKDGVVSVREVRDAFKTLNTEASKITQNFTGQLSKTDAAIRRLAKGEEEIKMLEASLKGLNNAPKEILKEINSVSRSLKNVQDIESKEGRTEKWASAYRVWADEVDKLSAKISVLHKQESNNATSTVYSKKDIENLLYVQKIMNTVSKTETELRKKLTKAGYTDIKITGIEDVNGKVEKLEVTANNAVGALEKINFARVKVQGEGNSKKIQDWLVQSGDVKILKSATTAQEELSESVSSVSVNLEKLKTKWKEQGILVGEFKEKVDKLELSLKSVRNQNELDGISSDIDSLKEEGNIQNKYNKIINSNDISKLETRYKKFGVYSAEAKQSIKDLKEAFDNLEKSNGTDKMSDAIKDFNDKLKIAQTNIHSLTTEQVSMSRRVSQMTGMQDWMRKNQKAVKLVGAEVESLIEECKTCDSIRFDQIGNRFKELKVEAGEAGLLGNTFFGSIVNEGKKFLQWTSITSVIMEVANKVRQAVGEIKQLDDVLTEISKTSDLTSKQLEKLGDNAFDTASKYGKNAQDFLIGVQEMYRAGFSNAEQMAELSVLAQSAGDMESTSANDYIMATNAAYDLKANAKELNEILDSQNYITNNAAISMQDMAEATSKAASVAAQYGVSIDELTALTAVAVSKTRKSGFEVGTALKSIFVNLQDTTNKAIVSAFDSVGISMTKMVGDSERLKTPIELIKELSVAFNSLPEGDVKRANILNDIGGKYHINTFSAILADQDAYNDMIELYNSQEADGSAFREAQKSAENFSGALNRLSNTWIDTVDNVLNSDLLTGFVNGLNTALNLLNTLTDSFGTFGTLGTVAAGVGVFAGFKNIGTANYISSPSNKLF